MGQQGCRKDFGTCHPRNSLREVARRFRRFVELALRKLLTDSLSAARPLLLSHERLLAEVRPGTASAVHTTTSVAALEDKLHDLLRQQRLAHLQTVEGFLASHGH
jgi:hypothetical protein